MNRFDQFKDVVASRGGRGGGRIRGRDSHDRGGSGRGSRGNMKGNFLNDQDHNQSGAAQGNHDKKSATQDSNGREDARGRGGPAGKNCGRGMPARGSRCRGGSSGGSRGRGGPTRGSRGRGGPTRGSRGRGDSSGGRRGRVASEDVRNTGLPLTEQSKNGDIKNKKDLKENIGSEIKDGLSLYVTFKDGPDVYEIEKLKGYHSLLTPPSKKEKEKIILFKDIESRDAARIILDVHQNVKSTNLMGFKSFKRQGTGSDNCRLFLRFNKAYDEDAVKELDSEIIEVIPLKDNSCCKVQFASPAEAISAADRLKSQIPKTGLKQVDVFAGSTATKSGTPATSATIQQDQIVLRDVPKIASIVDFANQFPEAVSYFLYNKTFPASKFCHAALRFEDTERVTQILKCKFLRIAGKKVYVFPAYTELLRDDPKLGEPESKTTEIKEEPLAKKRKVDVPGDDRDELKQYSVDEEEENDTGEDFD